MPELLKPELYDIQVGSPDEGKPILKGGKCSHCGFVFFPLQSYGCEICGQEGASLQPNALASRGSLIASATVHMHTAAIAKADVSPLKAPFTIGTIKLDDGPTIRTVMTGTGDHRLTPGQRVEGVFVDVGAGTRNVLDLRFTPIS